MAGQGRVPGYDASRAGSGARPHRTRQGQPRRFALATRHITLLATTLLVAACARVFVPNTISLSETRLQELIARQVPAQTRRIEPFVVRIAAPLLTLLPEQDRLAVELQVSVTSDLLPLPPLSGAMFVTQRLRYEPSDHTIRLVDVQVARFAVGGVPQSWQDPLLRIGRPLAEAVLKEKTLYALKPEDAARLTGRGVQPGAIHVRPARVEIELLPADQR